MQRILSYSIHKGKEDRSTLIEVHIVHKFIGALENTWITHRLVLLNNLICSRSLYYVMCSKKITSIVYQSEERKV